MQINDRVRVQVSDPAVHPPISGFAVIVDIDEFDNEYPYLVRFDAPEAWRNLEYWCTAEEVERVDL